MFDAAPEWEVAHVEAYAASIRRALKLGDNVTPLTYVDVALGMGAIRIVPGRSEARVVWINGRWHMVIATESPAPEMHFAMTVAFCRWSIREDKLVGVIDPHLLARTLALPRTDRIVAELRSDGVESVAARLVVPFPEALIRVAEMGILVADVVDLSEYRTRVSSLLSSVPRCSWLPSGMPANETHPTQRMAVSHV